MNPGKPVMKRILLSLFIGSYLAVAATLALASDDPQPSQQPTPASAAPTAPKPVKTGEQVFNNNCSRCHQPPMSIPPRATGTVVMHMRTRARLSREDEQLLLHFLAP